jgi:hypothetical protein
MAMACTATPAATATTASSAATTPAGVRSNAAGIPDQKPSFVARTMKRSTGAAVGCGLHESFDRPRQYRRARGLDIGAGGWHERTVSTQDPQPQTVASAAMKNFLLRFFTWWNGQTFGTQLWTWLYGEFVGQDEFGNRYSARAAARSTRCSTWSGAG